MIGRSSSFQLLRVFGIRIGVDASWFLILFLAIFFLQDSFRGTVEGSDTTAYAAAVAAAFLFFGSIVLHELGHALVARREGIAVTGIDLFFFGGLMRMSRDTDSPGAEFRVAVAGPLVTLGLVIASFAGATLIAGSLTEALETALLREDVEVGVPLLLLSFVGSMNVALLVFNLVPAFPLDGGRIARAAVWKATGDRNRATRVAAALGRGFGFLLMAVGVFMLFNGLVYDGLVLGVLGWLISQSARGAVAHTMVTERLQGITVADIMDPEPVTIPAELTADRAYEDYFLRYQGWGWFAVVESDGRYVGRAERGSVEAAAHGDAPTRPVRELTGADAEGRVPADAPLEALLGSEPLRRLGALMAVDGEGRLRGVVTIEQVSRALRAHFATSA